MRERKRRERNGRKGKKTDMKVERRRKYEKLISETEKKKKE